MHIFLDSLVFRLVCLLFGCGWLFFLVFISQEKELTAGKNGELNLSFREIKGAKRAQVTIKKLDGSLVKTIEVPFEGGIIKDLYPGSYLVEARAIDQYGRTGLSSETRKIIVPEVSNLKKPTIKKLRIR